MFAVANAIGCVRQEVKHGAIVPEISGWRGPLPGNVNLDPCDRCAGEALLCTAKRGTRDINDGEAFKAASEQPIDETGIPAPNVNYSTAGIESRRVEQAQR